MKKFLLFLITVIITAAITACICLFVIPKKCENKTANTTSNNQNTKEPVEEKYEEIKAKYDNEEDDWIKDGKGPKVAFSEKKDGFSGLSITEIKKNDDGTYTIKGIVYEPYKVTDEELKELEKTGYITIYGDKYKKVANINGYEGISLVKDGENELVPTHGIDKDRKDLVRNDQWGVCYRITDKRMQITLPGNTLVLGTNEYDMEAGNGTTVEELYNTKKEQSDYDDGSGNISALRIYNFVFKDDKCIELYSIPYES